MRERRVYQDLYRELARSKPMVFLAGPRQAGRYFLFHLPPFTLGELAGASITVDEFLEDPERSAGSGQKQHAEIWDQLARSSGFPEPFTSGSRRHFQRWSQAYQAQLIREDVRDLTGIRNIDLLDHLYTLLPARVGSLLSMDALARDLQVSPPTVKVWLETLDSLFMTFRLSPWSRNVQRALRKERKLYLFNYAVIESAAARFENMVACELLRAVTLWRDYGLGNYSLHYVRNKAKEEVDFLIAENRRPRLLVECKLSADGLPAGLLKFQKELRTPAVLVTQEEGQYRKLNVDGLPVLTINAARFAAGLPGRFDAA